MLCQMCLSVLWQPEALWKECAINTVTLKRGDNACIIKSQELICVNDVPSVVLVVVCESARQAAFKIQFCVFVYFLHWALRACEGNSIDYSKYFSAILCFIFDHDQVAKIALPSGDWNMTGKRNYRQSRSPIIGSVLGTKSKQGLYIVQIQAIRRGA